MDHIIDNCKGINAGTTAHSRETVHNIRRRMNLLLRTGQILVDSSADTSRIVRNMHRAAAFLGFKTEYIHIYVDYYMLTVSFSDEHHSFVQMRRCYKHGIDMAAIQDISKLTWRALRRDYSLDDYENALNWVGTRKRTYSDWAVAICAGFACGGFCIQFGCDWTAFFYASIAAILGNRLKMWLNAQGSNNFFDIAVAAFVSTIIAWLSTFISVPGNAVNAFVSSTPWLSFLLSSTPWHPLMACALFIVPGVPLINFVSDMLDNHIETGLVRATNTLLMIVAMSFGIAVAIKFCGIDNFVRTLSMTPHHTFIEYGIAAAISAMGFATIFNTPLRLQPWIACGGTGRCRQRLHAQLRQPRTVVGQYRTRLRTNHRNPLWLSPYLHYQHQDVPCHPHPAPVHHYPCRHSNGAGSLNVPCPLRVHRHAGCRRRGDLCHEQRHQGQPYPDNDCRRSGYS